MQTVTVQDDGLIKQVTSLSTALNGLVESNKSFRKEMSAQQDKFDGGLKTIAAFLKELAPAIAKLNSNIEHNTRNQIAAEEARKRDAQQNHDDTQRLIAAQNAAANNAASASGASGTGALPNAYPQQGQPIISVPENRHTSNYDAGVIFDHDRNRAAINARRGQGFEDTDEGTKGITNNAEAQKLAASLQSDQKSMTLGTWAAVKILKSIQECIVPAMSKLEQFNDDMRRTYRMSGETSTRIMDATIDAKQSVSESLRIHINLDEGIRAIKNQILQNGVNADHLNKATQTMAVGLEKMGVKLDRDALFAVDSANFSERSQKTILEALEKAGSGSNTVRTDTTRLGDDIRMLISGMQGQGRSEGEIADAIRTYTGEVQKLTNQHIEQGTAQKMAMAAFTKELTGADLRAKDPTYAKLLSIAGSYGVNGADMSASELMKTLRGIPEIKEDLKRYNATLTVQAMNGDKNALATQSLINSITQGTAGHDATLDEARKGLDVPLLERVKDTIGTSLASPFTGAISSLWGVNGKGTTQELVSKGFNAVITLLTAQMAVKAFPKIGEFLETVGKSTGAIPNIVRAVTSVGAKALPLLKSIGLPVLGIAASVGAVYKVVSGWHDWVKRKSDTDDANRNARNTDDEITYLRREMSREKSLHGESRSYREMQKKLNDLMNRMESNMEASVDAANAEHTSTFSAAGATAGAVTGAGIAFRNTSGLDWKYRLAAVGLAALGGAFGGGFLGESLGKATEQDNSVEARREMARRLGIKNYAESKSGNIFDEDGLTRVAEGGRPEVVMPGTDPERMRVLAESMAQRTDIPEKSKSAFQSMSESVKDGKDYSTGVSDGANAIVRKLIDFASSQKGKEYELHGATDPRTGKPMPGYVCNQLVAHAFKAAGFDELFNRFSYGVSSIVYGYDVSEKRDRKGNVIRKARHVKGLLEDPDWVTVDPSDIKPGMIVFTGVKEKPGHVGIATDAEHYWNASGSASIYSSKDVEGFLRTRTKNTGVVHTAWPKKYFKLAGYFRSLFGDYSNASPVVLSGSASENDSIGDAESAPAVTKSMSAPEEVASASSAEATVRAAAKMSDDASWVVQNSRMNNLMRLLENLPMTSSMYKGVRKPAALALLRTFQDRMLADNAVRGRIARNIFDETQASILDAEWRDTDTRNRLMFAMMGQETGEDSAVDVKARPIFGSLAEGFSDYLASLNHSYTELGQMDAYSQSGFLRDRGLITSQQMEYASMRESMKELSQNMRQLTDEMREQNREMQADRLRRTAMPMTVRM